MSVLVFDCINDYQSIVQLKKKTRKKKTKSKNYCCFCNSVTKSCLTLCDPMDYSTSGLPVLYYLTSHELVVLSNHLIFCCPLLLPSIFPSIRVVPSESVLCIRWPKYRSFSFSMSFKGIALLSIREKKKLFLSI